MRKIMLVAAVIVVILMALSAGAVLAGDNNQNGDHGSQGTERENGKDGCQARGGDYWVYIDSVLPPEWSHEWEGGPCCPSNEPATDYGSSLPLPNQCCNPPDIPFDGEGGHPGNHCLCFFMRGYPITNAVLP